MTNLNVAVNKFYDEYVNNTPKKLKIIDAYLFYIVLTGVIQFLYCCLVGSFPFNSFLSGFISTVSFWETLYITNLKQNHIQLYYSQPLRRNYTSTGILLCEAKTCVPNNVFHGENKQLTTKSLAKFNFENSGQETSPSGPKSLCAQSVLFTLSVLSIRPKDETPEEKRERKRLLKEYRFERRAERKGNSLAFKEEKKQQEKIKINNRNNVQGNRIV